MIQRYLSTVLASTLLFSAGPALGQAFSIASPLKKEPRKDNAASERGVTSQPAQIQEGKIEATDYSVSSPDWEKYYRSGIAALQERRFDHAEQMLLKSIKESKSVSVSNKALIDSRLALADVYMKQRRFSEANDLYRTALPRAQDEYGARSEQAAECLYGLAYTNVKFGNEKVARTNAEEALRILKEIGKTDTELYGLTLHTLGLVMAEHGWSEDAKPIFSAARKVLERHPGTKKLDLAEVLREQSLFFHSLGDRHTAHDLYETSYQYRERAVVKNQSPSVVGEVHFAWEPGSTRAQEIIDNDFPFRYMSAHGVRVACTIIDLWELLGILVCITNVGDRQEEFELGKIKLERVSPTQLSVRAREIPIVEAGRIDRIQKELRMWDLTHTRPWLANIQKTRTVRGLVPPNGHDLFMGPNVFGVYGEWKAISHIVPERVGVMPSREGLVAAETTAVDLPGLVRPSKVKLTGLTPVWLEPFESRTGELFYLYPRDADIVIKIPVGNATFEFPFHTRKFRIPRSI